jgi:hypothetical protein
MTCCFVFVRREAVSNLWTNLLHNSESDVAVTERRRRITIATIWFILTLVLALLSPDIGSVIDILGSLAAIFIFVFPGKLYTLLPLHRWEISLYYLWVSHERMYVDQDSVSVFISQACAWCSPHYIRILILSSTRTSLRFWRLSSSSCSEHLSLALCLSKPQYASIRNHQ